MQAYRAIMASSSSFHCPLCSGVFLPSYRAWLSHLRHVHAHDPNFHITCGVDSCPSTFRKFTTLYSHVYRKHKQLLEPRERGSNNVVVDANDDQSASLCNDLDLSDSTVADIQRLMKTDEAAIRRQSALFLLKMKEKRFLSQAAIDDIVEDSCALFTRTFEMVKAGVREKLAEAGVDSSSVNLDDVFGGVTDPFAGLRSKHFQEKYFEEHLGLIEPEEKQLGDPYSSVQYTGSKRRQVTRYDTFHYVPLLSTLQVLLRDDSIRAEISNCGKRVRRDGSLEDFCDGSVFNQHELFSSDPEALQIVGYYDELEITNPIGAYVKKHKVGIVFFVLANVHPKFRSRLRAVNLVAVARVEHVEKHGINAILSPFVQDLNRLATDGVSITANGVTKVFRGTLIAFLADTQASHLVGGFKKSVGSAYRMCRTCMATAVTFRQRFNSNHFQRRSTATHIQHCDSLQGALKEHNSKVYGVNTRSVLLDVKLFSMCNWGMPHDIMHDLFEGVVQYELKLLLLHCISEGYVSLSDFNKRLLSFGFGYSELADKPVPLTSQHVHSKDGKHLRQGSAQTWLLARILPFLIASDIPESNMNWKCFLKLLRIIDIALAPVVNADICAVLKVLIEEHHELFSTLYPNWTVTPKMHYMTHYPEQILALGPLVRAWTMRYEAKLCLLKNAGRVSNFKNITQTISTRHQRWVCYEFSSGGILSSAIECGPVNSKLLLRDEAPSVKAQISNHVPGISDDIFVSRVTWAKINGLLYKPKDAYLLCSSHIDVNAEPISCFGCIEEILVCSSDLVFFLMLMYKSQYYDDHFHAYVVERTSERLIVPFTNVSDHSVLHCRNINDKYYIATKYYVHI